MRLKQNGPLLAAALAMILVCGAAAMAKADPVRVYAAGSLSGAMKEIIAASGIAATPTFGPAGLLRERIENGEGADLFASADLAQPGRLAGKGSALPVVPFARNGMCLAAKASLTLTPDTLLDALLDPAIRLATSTPGADPGGDYALAVFDRADAVKPGAGKTLRDKALKLLGGPNTMVPVDNKSPAASIFLADRADALLYYCSGAAAVLREAPHVVSLPLPANLAVEPIYGLTILGRNAEAMRLALFILSADGQAILTRSGLLPIAAVK